MYPFCISARWTGEAGSVPIDYGGAPSEIYRNLRERILRGQIRSGSRIRIGAVAEEFGVSIIPVREALRMLAADRLIDLLPRRSPVISGITAHEVLEISAIRLALEPLALAGAIPNMSGETLRKSREVLEDLREVLGPLGPGGAQPEVPPDPVHILPQGTADEDHLRPVRRDDTLRAGSGHPLVEGSGQKRHGARRNPESLRSKGRGKRHGGAPFPSPGIQ